MSVDHRFADPQFLDKNAQSLYVNRGACALHVAFS